MKTVLFDLDGTLVASGADLAHAVNLTRRAFGLPARPEPEIVACIGSGIRKLVERAIPELPGRVDELLALQLRNYREHCLDRTALYPGVAETLAKLNAGGFRLAVVTNKHAALARGILAGLGVLDAFRTVVGGDECPAMKPDPAPLLLAAERMGASLDPADWMVGDNETDLGAARRAGIRGCFCRFGMGRPGGEAFDAAIDRFDRLAEPEFLTG